MHRQRICGKFRYRLSYNIFPNHQLFLMGFQEFQLSLSTVWRFEIIQSFLLSWNIQKMPPKMGRLLECTSFSSACWLRSWEVALNNICYRQWSPLSLMIWPTLQSRVMQAVIEGVTGRWDWVAMEDPVYVLRSSAVEGDCAPGYTEECSLGSGIWGFVPCIVT